MIYNKMVGGNMKKNKGFTLIEILAVVTIIGLIFILVIPKITTSLKNKKSDVDTTTTNLVFSATKLYVSDHSSKFEKTDGNVSCMPLHQLVKKGYLDGPVKNVTDDLDITNGKSVRITYNKGFKYELVDNGECSVVYNEILKDKDGNKYTIVEYIESTGTQYIDTDAKLTQNSKIEMKMNVTQAGKYAIFGSRTSATENNFEVMNDYNNFFLDFDNYLNNRVMKGVNFDINEIEISNNRLKIGDYVKSIGVYGKFETPDNAYVFYISGNPAGGHEKAKMRLYYCKIYDNDTLVRDYIPVIDSSERPCLFDKVSKECFYNQGTGEFLWG